MRGILSLLTYLVFLSVYSQEQEDYVNELLLKEINALRQEKGLHALVENEILEAAAFDQGVYIDKIKKVVHTQEAKKKENLANRLGYYEGLFASAGENASIISMGSKEAIILNGPRVELKTELDVVKAAVASWLEDEDSKLNLLDNDFYNIGLSSFVNESEYIIVGVFASLAYENGAVEKLPINLYGIESYKKEVCAKFLENHSTLPQLFSDALKVEDSEVYFEFHDLKLVESILSSPGDAFAVDLINDEQFNCGSGNRIFPTDIADGYLLPPISRTRLNLSNLADSIQEVKISLGKLPANYSEKINELNLIIIKDNHHCETVPFNRINTETREIFKTPYLLAGYTKDSTVRWLDSSFFVYPYDKNGDWESRWKKDTELLKKFNYHADSVEIIVNRLDPEKVLKNTGTNAFLNKEPVIKYNSLWPQVNEFIKNSFYQLDMANMNDKQKVAYMDSVMEKDADLKQFVDSLQLVTVQLNGKAELPENLGTEESIELLKNLLDNDHLASSIYLQGYLINKVIEGKLDASRIPTTDPPQLKYTLPLINNQIVLGDFVGEEMYYGNPIHLALLELYLIDKRQKEVNYNYHLALLNFWMENKDDIKGFEKWEKEVMILSGSDLPKEKDARLMLKYNLLAADYYYEKSDFNERKKAFKNIMKWQSGADLSETELLELAKFLCQQDQFEIATELLENRLKKVEPHSELLFFYLQIAPYTKSYSEENYLEWLKTASKKFEKEFCTLFSKKKMGVQKLKNTSIKNLYCKKCR